MFLGGGQLILDPFSLSEKQDFKNFVKGTLTINIHIFRLKMDEQFLFNPQWALKTNKTHETACFFIHLVGLECPLNHPLSIIRAYCVNVNNQRSYQSKPKKILLYKNNPCTTQRRAFYILCYLVLFIGIDILEGYIQLI